MQTHETVSTKPVVAVLTSVHAWGYRRYVVASLPAPLSSSRSPADELKYTTKKIESNFSNFSAWHYRTKLLPRAWASLSAEEVAEEKDKGEPIHFIKSSSAEFELVTQALWTDPGDQSGWLYHRWLIGEGELDTVEKILPQIPTRTSWLERWDLLGSCMRPSLTQSGA